ncbi:thiamine biosynthesis oxidoreductase ThiO [Neoasaia chiangmaiensis NBRC 101099]|uniref:Thiamine biosynthesis protein thio n=1 Tax=Neoasaia chiangmaiensis TaxID=320497 RepID=A0A1U9KMP0_9PROT|nr:glycine oxidase ThiO [Neoasaia chiangmaiensis]AQS87052.1 thiamine biosynthesis protein thio [Neoasaia chiangmaiensis]GBR37928.1 thiamine biosynthesis oxidoreductase ThiO [Neoasaia chiangmaiensis NBRC 101099]GEN15191.1 glycine oxidase ThiO [Neoasaia chiangmaiensis]
MTENGPSVLVLGAGVAGLVTAVTLAEQGARIVLHERGARVGSGASWFAGGMLAPWCEAESAPAEVTRDAVGSLEWWIEHVPNVQRQGTLVVAPPRDVGELGRFGRRTSHFETISAQRIGQLEPDLADRFDTGLFFPDEGHVDPRQALTSLREKLRSLGGVIRLDTSVTDENFDWYVDCTGMGARQQLGTLRGVRGEMLLLRCPELNLHRPVRLLHPRIPVYVVPRADNLFMIGATMVESDDERQITVRAMTDLLNAAYTLHPAFADAEIVEANAGLRPSFPDNVPRVSRDGQRIYVNGMYRHGFLLSPSRAKQAADIIFNAAEAD